MPKTICMVRAGQYSIFINDFLEKNMVAIGWPAMGDLTNIHGREEIAALVRVKYPEFSNIQVAISTGQIYRFRDEIARESLVITYDSTKRIYYVGRVSSEYAFQPNAHEELRNTRSVDWLGEIPRDNLSAGTKNSLGSIATVFSLTEIQTIEIEAHISGNLQRLQQEEKGL